MFELNEKAFKDWFDQVASGDAEFTSARRQAWEQMEEMVALGESPHYELEAQYTRSGNVEIYSQ